MPWLRRIPIIALLALLAGGCKGERTVTITGPHGPDDPLPTDYPVLRGQGRPLIMGQPLLVRPRDEDVVASFFPEEVHIRTFLEDRRGPELLLTSSIETPSGAYGLVLDREERPVPLTLGFGTGGERQWEIGLDLGLDASGQGRGPDYVLAYDNAEPTGDRFRMAPGGYTVHSPTAGSPELDKRFHIVGGDAQVDQAPNVLYVQSGSEGTAGVADWLIRGQGQNPDTGEWGTQNFGVTTDGTVEAGAFTGILSGGQRDVVTLRKNLNTDRAWLHWQQGSASWRVGMEGHPPDLHVRFNEDRRFTFAADGTALADQAWVTFSPVPPKPRAAMTLIDWVDWAYQDAAKPVKPYDGIPDADHPRIRQIALRSGLAPHAVAAAERRRYGKDISRIAIGVGNWAQALTRAIREADDFEALQRAVGADHGAAPPSAPRSHHAEVTALRSAAADLARQLDAAPAERPASNADIARLAHMLERTLGLVAEQAAGSSDG